MASVISLGRSSDRVSQLRRLLGRRGARYEEGLFVIEGPQLVSEALLSNLTLHSVVVAERGSGAVLVADALAADVDVYVIEDKVFDSVATTGAPQPALAVAEMPSATIDDLADTADGFVIVLDGVADPGNAGTLIRLAEAVGAMAVIFANAVDPFNPKTVRSSSGSICRVPVIIDDHPADALRAAGFRLIGAEGAGEPYDEIDPGGAVALVLGSEAHGLSIACDANVALPMLGHVESLNVAVAGSVLAYDLMRRRA
jgi:TrmH family RNA methyltransferase